MSIKLNKAEAQDIIGKYVEQVNSKDAKRLEIIANLLDENGEINIKVVEDEAYADTADPNASLRKSKKAIKDKAKEIGLTLIVKTDNNKKLWFEGDDLRTDKVFKQRETLSQQDSDIDNYAVPQKTELKYFVSYAHKNEVLAKKFITEFIDHSANRKKYNFTKWIDGDIIVGEGWNEQIQEALVACDFGLLLLSANYFTRPYILNKELPHFIRKDKDGNVIVLKSMFPVGLEKFDINADLKGLEEKQIYLFQKKPGADIKFFNECSGPNTGRFVIDCVKSLEAKLKFTLEKPDDFLQDKKSGKKIKVNDLEKMYAQKGHLEHCETDKDIDNYAAANKLSEANHSEQKVKASNLIDSWLQESSKSVFAVLGQFGMGKTFTLQKYTIKQLDILKEEKDNYYPFYFDLRKFEMNVLEKTGFTVWDIIASILGRNKTLEDKNPLTAADVENFWSTKNTLMIFDGLDEVLPHIADAKMDSHFMNELFKLVPKAKSKLNKDIGQQEKENSVKRKMILSCRTDYFSSISAQYSFFQNQNRENIKADNDYDACFLLPFDEKQILTYLGKTFPNKNKKNLYETLKKVHNLIELSSRPVLLDFISEIFDKIEVLQLRKGTVTTANLYDLIIDKSFQRDDGKHELSVTVKKLLLEEIAAYLWKRSTKKIAFDKLETFLGNVLASGNAEMKKIWQEKESENLYKDLRNASFLTRSNEKDFGFSHTSIQEYFLAKYIVSSIVENKWKNLELKNVSPETIDFVMDLVEVMDIDDLSDFNTHWKKAFDNEQQEKNRLLLAIYIKDFKSKHLLEKPTPFDLSNLDLSHINLSGKEAKYLDFSNAILKGANLRNGHLTFINFDNANLNKVDLRDSKLQNIDMYHTKMKKAIASGHWRKIKGVNIDIKDADLEYTQISRSTFPTINKSFKDAIIINQTDLPKIKTIENVAGHTSKLNCAVISPDGNFALSSSDDGTMKYWDLNTQKEIFSFNKHTDGVTSCAFSPDGNFALSASRDNTMKYWDLKTKKEIFSFEKHTDRVTSCAFSSDGNFALSTSSDGTMKYWDLNTKKEIFSFDKHTDWVNSCAFSPDGNFALSASEDGTMKYWDLNTQKEIFSFDKHTSRVNSCAFSPDGNFALSASVDGTMKYWDLNTKKEIFSFDKHTSFVNSCAFSSDGNFALSASYGGTMKYWDLNTKKEISFYHFENNGLAVIEDGRLLYHNENVWEALEWKVKDENGLVNFYPFDAFKIECS